MFRALDGREGRAFAELGAFDVVIFVVVVVILVSGRCVGGLSKRELLRDISVKTV